jgi:hypothetical protein
MSIRTKLLATASVAGLLAATAVLVVSSAFTSTTQADGNRFSAGTITLTSGSSGTALFDVDGLRPGSSVSRCVVVRHAATEGLTSNVRLYGTTGGALADALDVQVVRGTQDAAGRTAEQVRECDGFSATGATPLFDGRLSTYPASAAEGIADPDGSWADGEQAAYRITATLPAAAADEEQGGEATASFAWQARTN